MISFKEVFRKKAFIGFITAGDPNIEATKRYINKMIEAGVSLIEIGIPFSDPIAEGEVITKADIRALKSGTTTDKIFEMMADIRKTHPDFPFVFMTYLNPVFSYGYDNFFKKAQEVGMLGIIIPDTPAVSHVLIIAPKLWTSSIPSSISIKGFSPLSFRLCSCCAAAQQVFCILWGSSFLRFNLPLL